MITNALDSSRRTLAAWVWEELAGIEFASFYDAFGGNCRVAQYFKRKGYQTFVSDILQSHYWRGVALIQNNQTILTPDHFRQLNDVSQAGQHQDFSAWQDHYFTKEEVQALSAWWHNIENSPEFQANPELKAIAYSAIYLTMGYWLQFNQYSLQSKPMPTADALRHYIQVVNSWVADNQMPNMAYYTDASLLVEQLQEVGVLWINPPAMQGFRDTNRKTELAECWTRRVPQLNLSGLVPTDEPRLGQTFEDEKTYLLALSNFLDRCDSSRVWAIAHSDRLGVSLEQIEELIESKRTIWKKSSLELPYPIAGETLVERESLLIAVAGD
ncbi:MAG: hypothetical protein CVV27_00650 [Candidatus Melainabacteria bacterium HGW-Melainabacteria-1]|nr:MAG: hypothetical protein CVV27_00650 [Candidatus Melainabacteria bacterium HGW-Melainabacteria-1]